MDYITGISFLIGIVGMAASAYGAYLTVKSNREMKESKTIDWGQFQLASRTIGKKLRAEYIPDILITPAQKGGIFAQMIMDNLDMQIPICTGFMVSKDRDDTSGMDHFFMVETAQWKVYIPLCKRIEEKCNVLIVDDWAMSGDFLSSLSCKLQEEYPQIVIKTCCVATTSVAIKTHKAPDYFWKVVSANECYFPWGKALCTFY